MNDHPVGAHAWSEAAPHGAAKRALPQNRFARAVVCVLGLPFDAVDVAGAVEQLRAAALSNTRCFVSTPNLNFLMKAQLDAEFRDSVLCSDLSLADGAPIVWVSRILGLPIVKRVAGADVFDALRAHPGPPLSVYFFGGPPGAAAAACQALNRTPSGLRCVGFDEAGFGTLDDMSTPDRIARINESGAQFVVVALGAKKGQAWIMRNQAALDAALLCHMGAVVNFVAGTVRRAPAWLQRLGLEWLWRVKEQPELWRRYCTDGAAFVRTVCVDVLPLAWQRTHRRQLAATVADGADAIAVDSEIGVTVRPSGALSAPNLALLRHALAEAVQRGCALQVVLAAVSTIDAAGIGLLLLGYGDLGFRLHLLEVPQVIRASLHRHGAGYLLGPDPTEPCA